MVILSVLTSLVLATSLSAIIVFKSIEGRSIALSLSAARYGAWMVFGAAITWFLVS